MSHVIVERRTLVWPRARVGGAGVTSLAIPGNPIYGTFTNAPEDDAASYQGDTFTALRSTLESCAARIDIPADTIAIGIAPDSIIHSCDIALGGMSGENSRHGVSPGSPLIGCPNVGFGLVTIRDPIPIIQSLKILGDCNAVRTPISGTSSALAWPLRLELFRSCVVPPQRSDKRAPMSSMSLISVPAAGRTLYTCVDGRRNVEIEIIAPDGAPGVTFTLFSIVPLRSEPTIDTEYGIQIPLDSAGTLSATVGAAGTEGKVFSFEGTPFNILAITLVSTGTSIVQVRVRGWD